MAGGGIPPHHAFVEIKLTFKDGGAFDFHSSFERVKDTLSQAVEVARESGHVINQGQEIDLSGVHLEQLPAYEEVGETIGPSPPPIQQPVPVSAVRMRQPSVTQPGVTEIGGLVGGPMSESSISEVPFQPPDEPPPGYEEAQHGNVVNRLEESVRRSE